MRRNLPSAAFILVVLLLITLGALIGCRGIIVTFDPDGGAIVSGDETYKYKGKEEVTAPVLSRDGYVFDGWDADFANPEDDVTPKAVWKKLYSLTFDIIPDEGEDNIVRIMTSDEAVVYPEDPEREGYVFGGWDKEITNLDSDTTVSALWRKLYTVTINLNGGASADTALLEQIIAEGDDAAVPAAEKQYMKPVKWDGEFTGITADTVINAVWERRELTGTEVAKLISPATVEVNTYRRNDIEWATGSGFFIDGEGTLVTNYHVIEDAYSIKIELDDGTVHSVTHVVAFDKELDLAILKINLKTPDYLETTGRQIEKGEVVYALGSSLGLEGTFTTGLVSTVSREVEGQNYIQISAAVSPGNSGGPLVDAWGYVIGINTLSASAGQNLNFSIPMDRLDKLRKENLSVTQWFDKYAKLKWWIMERIVDESDKGAGLSHQLIPEGATVRGTHNLNNDVDNYVVVVPAEYHEQRNKQEIDMYLYYYSEDFYTLLNMGMSWTINATLSGGTFTPIRYYDGYNEFSLVEYGEGYLLCVALYDIYSYGVNNAGIMIGFSLENLEKEVNDYYAFVMFGTEEDRE